MVIRSWQVNLMAAKVKIFCILVLCKGRKELQSYPILRFPKCNIEYVEIICL